MGVEMWRTLCGNVSGPSSHLHGSVQVGWPLHSIVTPFHCFALQDGRWGYAPNLPTRMDGDNQNNWVAVPYRNIDPAVQVLRSFIRACAPGREEGFWPGGPGRLPAVTLHARSTAGGSWQASRCPPTCPCRPPASEF
jgi:hypothetical protein